MLNPNERRHVGTRVPTKNDDCAQRKWLGHETPWWVKDSPLFFITLCAAKRDINTLAYPSLGSLILNTAKVYHDRGRWYVGLITVMPDHIHFLSAFSAEESLVQVMTDWRRYLARTAGLEWQRGFFDYRIRNEESVREKADYIRMNPVRAGLVTSPEEWPYTSGEWQGWKG